MGMTTLRKAAMYLAGQKGAEKSEKGAPSLKMWTKTDGGPRVKPPWRPGLLGIGDALVVPANVDVEARAAALADHVRAGVGRARVKDAVVVSATGVWGT